MPPTEPAEPAEGEPSADAAESVEACDENEADAGQPEEDGGMDEN